MTPEQMEHAIEFILNEQARITTNFEMYADQSRQEMREFRQDMRKLKDAQAETARQIQELRGAQQKTDDTVRHLSKQQTRTSATLDTFMEAMTKFMDEMRKR